MTAVAAPQIVALRLDGTPANYRRLDWWSQRRAATPWRKQVAHLLAASGPALEAERVTARIVATFTDRRRRNPELYGPVPARATWEALVELGWIADRDRFSIAAVEVASGKKPSTLIELTIERAEG